MTHEGSAGVPGTDSRFAGGNEKLTVSFSKAANFSQAKTNRKKLPAISLRLQRRLLYGKLCQAITRKGSAGVPGTDFRFIGGNEKLTASCFKAVNFPQTKNNRKKLPAINLRLKRRLLYGKRQAIIRKVNLHLYHYAGNNPLKYTDPDGNYAEITRKGNEITIVVPVRFAEGSTKSQKSQFKISAQGIWTGNFGKYKVSLIIEERDVGEYNTVKFAEAEDKYDISNVVDTKHMTLYDNDLKKERAKVMAHEVGHLMNLEDRYDEFFDSEGNRTTKPKENGGGNIMGVLNGNVEISNIDEILKSNTVTEL
jgi:ribosomal protein S8E